MFITTHAAIGALIGSVLPGHPYLVTVLAVISHFVTDIIPHGDSQLYKGFTSGGKVKRAIAYVTIDAVFAMLFVLYLLNNAHFVNTRTVSIGIAAAVIPDLAVASYELFKFKKMKWFHKLHFWFHNMISGKRGDISLGAGFAMQVVLFVGLVMRMVR